MIKRLLLLVSMFLAQSQIFGALAQSTLAQEQSEFSTEGEVTHNIPLPLSVRELLERDSFVQETLKAESPPRNSLPEDWTLCSIVHLANERERDYVVIGQRLLTGAHATHFWVYRETPQGVRLVLTAFADSLSIGKRKTNGLRNIAAMYYTAVTDGTMSYTFDGTAYKTKRPPQYR
ncbi:hypothetical protein [Edaphobacter aggregans]|uniref:hypothetical protein n=1 Tax=Edaphobacter aggregans TaxID=570835 RepID=UPI0005561E38|nr:hypothetical protein [Edaphobacter aggregans]